MGAVLYTNSTLQSLNLSHNKITRDGAVAFAFGLRRKCPLKSLSIACNHISNAGVTSIAQALTVNHLEALYLSDTGMADTGLTELAKALETNTTLKTLKLNPDGNGCLSGFRWVIDLTTRS